MPDKPWKQAERRVASMFGCLRQVLSGSSSRDDSTCSDTTHHALFLEVKYRQSHSIRRLWEATRVLARKEKKTPVLALVDKNKPGFLLAFHSDDIDAVIGEYGGAMDDEGLNRLTTVIRRAVLVARDELEEEEEDEAA